VSLTALLITNPLICGQVINIREMMLRTLMDCLLSLLKFAMSLCFVRKYVGTVRMYLGLLELPPIEANPSFRYGLSVFVSLCHIITFS
jgi:hypothetical protein